MIRNNEQMLEYWNRDEVESMYDKHLLNAEIELIKRRISAGSKILDAGCGEGEGTRVYCAISGVQVHAVDFSETRLKKAAQNLQGFNNVILKQVDFLEEYQLDCDYDFVVSQRFMINLLEWSLQQKVLTDLMSRLRSGGRLLMLEGSQPGVDALNEFRAAMGLDPIPVKWHNLFFDDKSLVGFMTGKGHRLVEEDGLGTYFVLTRGVRPAIDRELNWDCRFNEMSASAKVSDFLRLGPRLSRLKLWVFEKV